MLGFSSVLEFLITNILMLRIVIKIKVIGLRALKMWNSCRYHKECTLQNFCQYQ